MLNGSEHARSETNLEDIGRLEAALLNMDRPLVWDILGAGKDEPNAMERMERLIVTALDNIGALWEKGQAALSQVYMSGRICEEAISAALDTGLGQRRKHPSMAIAALEDSHALGKRMVLSSLLATGFTVKDYGHGVGAEALAERAVREQIDILLISTLMLRSAIQIARVVTAIRKTRPQTRILVGGAPFRFDKELWRQTGADAMGCNASEAAVIVGKWCLPS